MTARVAAAVVLGALAIPWSPIVRAGQLTTHESPAPPQPTVIPLWPEGVPGAKPNGGVERLEDGRVYNVQSPTLTYYPPADGTSVGTAVIVCPGGGYARLAQKWGVP